MLLKLQLRLCIDSRYVFLSLFLGQTLWLVFLCQKTFHTSLRIEFSLKVYFIQKASLHIADPRKNSKGLLCPESILRVFFGL